jgi:hypothetical protein
MEFQMKAIKFAEKYYPTIVKAINAAEGKATVNLLTIKTVEDLVEHAEKRLAKLEIAKKYRPGAEFYYCPCGPSANAYKYGQGATCIRLSRKSADWFVEDISRTSVYPKSSRQMDLKLTVAQKVIAVKHFCGTFTTLATPQRLGGEVALTMKNSVSA